MDRDLLRRAIQRVREKSEQGRQKLKKLPGMETATGLIRQGVEKTKPYEPVIEIDSTDEDEEEERKKLYALRQRLRKQGL